MTEFDAVVLVGAGVVENGWEPVLRALELPDPATANFYFARLVSGLRHDAPSSRREYFVKTTYDTRLAEYQTVKRKVADALTKAHKGGEIRVRDGVYEALSGYIDSPPFFVTTNWDHTLLDFVMEHWPKDWAKLAPYPLHGSADERLFEEHISASETLTLPFEQIQEEYHSGDIWVELARGYGLVFSRMMSARRIVIHGLKMSELDAEVGMLMEVAFRNDNLQDVVIINPSADEVQSRLRVLKSFSRSRRDIKVVKHDPMTGNAVTSSI